MIYIIHIDISQSGILGILALLIKTDKVVIIRRKFEGVRVINPVSMLWPSKGIVIIIKIRPIKGLRKIKKIMHKAITANDVKNRKLLTIPNIF